MVDDINDVVENNGKNIFVSVRYFYGKILLEWKLDSLKMCSCCICVVIVLVILYLEDEYENVGMCDVICLFINFVCL